MDIKTYEALGLNKTFQEVHGTASVNDRSNTEIMNALDTTGDAPYHPCPQAFPNPDTPTGAVTHLRDWQQSKIYPETQRDIWIYTPAQFNRAGPAPGMLFFNDGGGYLDRAGAVRATHVLDTLIHRGELAPKIGVFVMPGRPLDVEAGKPGDLPDPRAMVQRSFEYDSLHDRFATFVPEEIVPLVESEIGATVSTDPNQNMTCGISSGGICAFTLAWHRPDLFGRVLSHCGSFTNIRGGQNYPYLIRSTPRKPVRVFLTSGARDADIILGSWPIANRYVAASLEFAGYDHRFEFGQGGHNLRHGGSLFADSLRWLFRT